MQNLKIATYNVNGIGTRLPNVLQWLDREQPDIVCLQELKAPDKSFPAGALEAAGYGSLHLGQPSWNGVAILARDAEPLLIRKGLPGMEDDTHARYLEAAVHGLVVGCLYLPNGNPQPGPKFDYKLKWFECLIDHAKTLQSSEHPVVLAGDYNVVPTDEDIYNTRSWLKDALLQPESRECYQRLLAQGWLDALRHIYPDERIYTYWDYFRKHWQTNSGLRIDHLLLNPVLAPHLQDAGVDAWVRGEEHASDHAPTWIRLGAARRKARKPASDTSRSAHSAPAPSTQREASKRKPDSDPTPEPPGTSKPKRSATAAAETSALPDSIKPELATLVESAPEGDWRYEIKFDGYRVMARVDHGSVQLFTRNGHDWTHKLPRQAEAIASLGLESAWLDGEMVVTNEQGVPDFQALQNAFDVGRSESIVYYLFDLPFLNGMDLREVALEQRREALSAVLKHSDDDVLRFSDDFGETPEDLLNSACQMQMEGLIGKRVGSAYVSRRSTDWIKLKCKRRQEFVVVGYTEPKGARSKFGALLLGLHDADNGELRYCGKVGTGFNEATLTTIYDQLLPLEIKKAAVVNPPTGFEAKGVHWLDPKLLAEVAFAEITQDGSVRHAVFQGLRNDKPAQAITEERPAPAKAANADKAPKAKKQAPAKPAHARSEDEKTAPPATSGKIRLTHPERVIDPVSGATKRDLADYCIRVSEWLLPQLAQRPVALVRAPEGVTGELFFQKNAEHLAIPGIETMGKAYTGHPVMLINNLEALVGAVQMSAMELHVWNTVAKDLERPDRFILDLDPDPALPWKSMVEATQMTQAVLDELGLKSFLKTSGGKGIHVVVPLTPKADWDTVKAFSHAIVKHMAKLVPDRFSAVSGPKNRVGRIFIDYLRNGLGATTVSAYSVRTREGLPVSVPIFPEEIHDIKGADVWTLRNLHERLDHLDTDPWAELASTRQTITADMRARVGMKK
ncbi:DNA ligase D [Pseudomonas abietaniphila]|uniref:DNA ligase (ATP) n=1 Tax=Pseudomonas abietaniphila TaxID=89065 RepID=A0A1G7VMT3_9PSED|nr:DNA ligase D [Pseudomonas abietaniphila]SDG61034.1 bifunctional non-homologous end joining protein LigD [Pseudomonas abietaniphila]